jgi:hypothetical protein
MDALAPAALALTVAFDVAATTGLVLMSYSGPFLRALLPMTHDVRLDIAAGLADIVAGSLIRSCCALVPLLGTSLLASTAGLAVSAVGSIAMTAWMSAKGFLAYQMSQDRLLVVADTGVTLHTPTLLAADLLAIFMSWFVFFLIWVNRNVMKQLLVTEAALQAQAASGWAYQHTPLNQQFAAVMSWLDSSEWTEPAEEPEPVEEEDPEQALLVPFLPPHLPSTHPQQQQQQQGKETAFEAAPERSCSEQAPSRHQAAWLAPPNTGQPWAYSRHQSWTQQQQQQPLPSRQPSGTQQQPTALRQQLQRPSIWQVDRNLLVHQQPQEQTEQQQQQQQQQQQAHQPEDQALGEEGDGRGHPAQPGPMPKRLSGPPAVVHPPTPGN